MKTFIGIATLTALLFAASSARAFNIGGFSNPYGIAIDGSTNYIYVSNVNGDANARDDNGFISRLKGDGTIDQLKLIDGASPKFSLNAPKGMAIIGTTLYVADIDKLHAFNLSNGAFLFDVNFGNLPVQHFYDVKVGPDNALYVADGPGNTIYRVDVPKQHEVTTFASGDSLGQPHSVVWFPTRQSFVVAGWSSGQVTAYDRSGKRQPYAAIFLRTLEGITADDTGSMYVASSGLNAIYRIAPNFALFGFQLGVMSPAGLAYHRAGSQIIAASIDTNTVQSIPIKSAQEETPPELVPLPSLMPQAQSPAAPAAEKPQAAAPPPAAAPEKVEAGKAAPAEKAPAPEKPAAEKANAEKPAPADKNAVTNKAAPAEKTPPAAGKPSPAKPETAKPDTAKPETAKPDATKQETAKPEVAKPEPPKQGAK